LTLTQAILVGLVAALTHLDGGWLGEAKFREPIVTGFLVGLIFGDVPHGLMIGATMQLLWMGVTGVGPTPKLDIGTGGTIGAAVALSTGTGAKDAIIFAVPVALLLQLVNTLMTSAFSAFMPYVDKKIDELKTGVIQGIHYLCGLIAALLYFGITFIGMYFGTPVIKAVVNGMPGWVEAALNGVAALLPALGFAMLLDVILTKKLIPFLILGFIPAAFVGHDLSMLGITAVAVALALIIYNLYSDLQSKNVAPQPALAGSADEWED